MDCECDKHGWIKDYYQNDQLACKKCGRLKSDWESRKTPSSKEGSFKRTRRRWIRKKNKTKRSPFPPRRNRDPSGRIRKEFKKALKAHVQTKKAKDTTKRSRDYGLQVRRAWLD